MAGQAHPRAAFLGMNIALTILPETQEQDG